MHGFFGKCASWCHNKSLGILLLRLSLGGFFISHGVAKIQGMEQVIATFGQWGLSPFWAYVSTYGELVAGALFVLGAFQWIAALIIAIDMIVAMYLVTWPNPLGREFHIHFITSWGSNLIYAVAALAIAFTGAGKWSLTRYWMHRRGESSMTCKSCKADHGMPQCCEHCAKDVVPPQVS